MEPLINQLKSLPEKWKNAGRGVRLAVIGGLLAIAGAIGLAVVMNGATDTYQYAFTNLTPEDSAAATGVLKTSGIPFRIEAGGSALAVPSQKVYDARLLLAAQGLPRAGGVGFELFDKGQFGVSEFTQKVNLRRAIEGELGRTIGALAEVRSARVHLSLGERGLYRDEDKKATASVVINLQNGRTLTGAQLQGIRNLVGSAVPGLSPTAVNIVDGHGAVLGEDAQTGGARAFEQKMENELQQKVVSLLEPVVGAGGVVTRVAVTADMSEVSQNSEVFDPDLVATRSERHSNTNQSSENSPQGGVAGAQANQPLVWTGPGTQGQSSKSGQGSNDDVKNYEISKTNTVTVIKQPRVRRISVAVLVDQKTGAPRSEAELARLGELVKKAVGFDEARGDQFQLSGETLAKPDAEAPLAEVAKAPWWLNYAIGGGAALILLVVIVLALRGGKKTKQPALVLKPGMKVSELEAVANGANPIGATNINGLPNALTANGANGGAAGATATSGNQLPGVNGVAGANGTAGAMPDLAMKALPSPEAVLRDKAIDLAKQDPVKTAQLIRAWLANDTTSEARRA